MSDTRKQAAGSEQFRDTLSSDAPRPPQGPSADKKHQLTVPNTLPQEKVQEHVAVALDSVASGTRVAVFDAAPTSDVETTIVSGQAGTDKYNVRRIKKSGMNSSETVSRQSAVSILTDILTTRTRDATGEFYTKSSVGPGAGTLTSRY